MGIEGPTSPPKSESTETSQAQLDWVGTPLRFADAKGTRSTTLTIAPNPEIIGEGYYAQIYRVLGIISSADGSKRREQSFVVKIFRSDKHRIAEESAIHAEKVHHYLKQNGLAFWKTYRKANGKPLILMSDGELDGESIISANPSKSATDVRTARLEITNLRAVCKRAVALARRAAGLGIMLHHDVWMTKVSVNGGRASLTPFIGDYDEIMILPNTNKTLSPDALFLRNIRSVGVGGLGQIVYRFERSHVGFSKLMPIGNMFTVDPGKYIGRFMRAIERRYPEETIEEVNGLEQTLHVDPQFL